VSTDSSACEFSRLTVPSDPRYAAVVARYAAEAARLIGFEEPMPEKILQGLQLGFPALVDYSFAPGEKAVCDISCERIPAGIKIVLHDKGLPFGVTGPATSPVGAPDTRIARLRAPAPGSGTGRCRARGRLAFGPRP
jgi:hypothetical protein